MPTPTESGPEPPAQPPAPPGTDGAVWAAKFGAEPSHSIFCSGLQGAGFFVLAAALIALAFPGLATGLTVPAFGDHIVFSRPFGEYARQCLRSGQIPLWCPFICDGIPFAAQWTTLVFYPPALLYLLLPAQLGFNLFMLLHVAWGTLGMFLLARRLSAAPFVRPAAIALSYEFCGCVLSTLNWLHVPANFSWVPWVILTQALAAQKGGRYIIYAAFCLAAQLLTGMPEFTVITLSFSYVVALFYDPAVTKSLAAKRWRAAVLIAVALSAIQLLPTALLALSSHRGRGLTNTNWAIDTTGLLNLVHPGYQAHINRGSEYPRVAPFFMSYHVGLAIAAMAITAVWINRKNKLVLALTFVSLLWTGLAYGPDSPVVRPIITNTPILNQFRLPIKYIAGLVLGLHLLACFDWTVVSRRRSYATFLGLAALFAGTLVLTRGDQSGRLLLRALYAFAVLGLLRFVAPTRLSATIQVLLLSALVMADGLSASRRIIPSVPVSTSTSPYARLQLEAQLKAVPPPEQHRIGPDPAFTERSPTLTNYHQLLKAKRSVALYNTALNQGLSCYNGFPSLTTSFSDYWTCTQRDAQKTNVLQCERMLDFEGVSYIANTTNLTWASRPQAMPIVYAGQAVKEGTSSEALTIFQDARFDPRRLVILPIGSHIDANADRTANATVEQFSAHYWRIATQATKTTVLTVAQTWYPHWKATINGTPTVIHRANVTFQAIVIPPGNNIVELRYIDPLFRIGAGISLLTVLASLAWLGYCRQSTRPQHPPWRIDGPQRRDPPQVRMRVDQIAARSCPFPKKVSSYPFQATASFAFLRHARSTNLRASLAPRSRQSELRSQSSFGQ